MSGRVLPSTEEHHRLKQRETKNERERKREIVFAICKVSGWCCWERSLVFRVLVTVPRLKCWVQSLFVFVVQIWNFPKVCTQLLSSSFILFCFFYLLRVPPMWTLPGFVECSMPRNIPTLAVIWREPNED